MQISFDLLKVWSIKFILILGERIIREKFKLLFNRKQACSMLMHLGQFYNLQVSVQNENVGAPC